MWDTLQTARVIYRDLNCKNTRVSRDGQLTLLDFDAAHVIGEKGSKGR